MAKRHSAGTTPVVGRRGARLAATGFVFLGVAVRNTSAAEGEVMPRTVSATAVERFRVYHSPQTPGYTCWVGAWLMPDGTPMIAFHQATGPFTG